MSDTSDTTHAAEVVMQQPLPATAVQALYHAATGKTENLQKRLVKNVIIRKNDIEQLYFRVLQQLDLFKKVAGPTVTITVKYANHETQQFSSWERFSLCDSGRSEITSDVVLKFEFLITMPCSDIIQRYVLTIDMDSQLPLVAANKDKYKLTLRLIELILRERFPSLTISVDFIDYLCAKSLAQTVEDWFDDLEESPRAKLRDWVNNLPVTLGTLFSYFANFGTAGFIALYSYLKGDDIGGPVQFLYLGSVAIVIWTMCVIVCGHIGKTLDFLILRSFVPSSIILTTGDERALKTAQDQKRGAVPQLLFHTMMAFLAISLNVLASFVYAWMTR